MKFKIGDKVNIQGHWNFPNDCNGTIAAPPEFAVQLVADEAHWEGISRIL
jgi:hypothetical protein